MYQSPISIYETAVQYIMEQRENAIFAKVQDAFDVQVDKKELIRALMYDRNQYEKGYFDGKEEATPKWIPATELLPEADKEVLCFTKMRYCWIASWNICDDRMWSDGEMWCSESEVTHWMPLPELPKEGA